MQLRQRQERVRGVFPPGRRTTAVPARAGGAGPPPPRPTAALAGASAVRRPALLEGGGGGLLALSAQHLELVDDLVELPPTATTTTTTPWRTRRNAIERAKSLVIPVNTGRLPTSLLCQSYEKKSFPLPHPEAGTSGRGLQPFEERQPWPWSPLSRATSYASIQGLSKHQSYLSSKFCWVPGSKGS